jgi:hypothetical protein
MLAVRSAREWPTGKTVIFIVTLAASGTVTLAARKAGTSRNSVYALMARDCRSAPRSRVTPSPRRIVNRVNRARLCNHFGQTRLSSLDLAAHRLV